MNCGRMILVLIACLLVFSVEDSSMFLSGVAQIKTNKTKVVKISGKSHKTDSPYGRLIVKFSSGTPRKIRERFFKQMGLQVVEMDVFGFDIGRWIKPSGDKMNISLAMNEVMAVLGKVSPYSIETYETEYPLRHEKRKKNRRAGGCLTKEPKMANPNKLFTHWFDKNIQLTDAHNFLRENGIPLAATGIVVIDEAPDFSHPDIRAALRYRGDKPIYWIGDMESVKGLEGDHGCHVSCLAAAKHDGAGIEGVGGPKAYILPLIANFDHLEIEFASDIARGLKFYKDLEEKREISWRVVNMSFLLAYPSKIVYAAMEQLSDKLFVVAAGNDSENLDVSKKQDIYPAAWPLYNKIAVASTTTGDKLADSSNYGKHAVAIAAPGVDVLSCAMGGKYIKMGGTSMASPLVGGTFLLLFEMHPNLTVTQAKSFLSLGAVSKKGLKNKINGGLFLNVYNSVRLLYEARNSFK